jgi:hypothetical protein
MAEYKAERTRVLTRKSSTSEGLRTTAIVDIVFCLWSFYKQGFYIHSFIHSCIYVFISLSLFFSLCSHAQRAHWLRHRRVRPPSGKPCRGMSGRSCYFETCTLFILIFIFYSLWQLAALSGMPAEHQNRTVSPPTVLLSIKLLLARDIHGSKSALFLYYIILFYIAIKVIIRNRYSSSFSSGDSYAHQWQISWKPNDKWSNPLTGWTSGADPLSFLTVS